MTSPGSRRRLALLAALLLCLPACVEREAVGEAGGYGSWMEKPFSEWPRIAMINQIEYADESHPVAGCGFLLDTGDEVLAATAKHVLVYFKSGSMDSVSFKNTLKQWRMFPKDSPGDLVVVDRLINEEPGEPLDHVPPERDWLLFTVRERSPGIQPLRLAPGPVQPGERVYIVGWRYSDVDCPQVVYAGNFVRSEGGSFLVTTDDLADNTMPGLSGAPVIDSRGYLIGLMSQKAGRMERPSSLQHLREILGAGRRPEK